jgi:hypothetical protein
METRMPEVLRSSSPGLFYEALSALNPDEVRDFMS